MFCFELHGRHVIEWYFFVLATSDAVADGVPGSVLPARPPVSVAAG